MNKFNKKNFLYILVFVLCVLLLNNINDKKYNNIDNKVTNIKYNSVLDNNKNNKLEYKLLSNNSSNKAIGTRYLQQGYSADGKNDLSCGSAVYIEYCDEVGGTQYCYFKDYNSSALRKVYRMKLSTTAEGANATCPKDVEIGYRYVVGDGVGYNCGDKVYITTCDSTNCKYKNGTIPRNNLRTTEAEAKADCKNKDLGDRYVVGSDGWTYSCGDKLYITNCNSNSCTYVSVNDVEVNAGVVARANLRNTKAVAEGECAAKGDRYVALDNNTFNCGDSLYITTCTDTICDYTKHNNSTKVGTVERKYLKDNQNDAKNDCKKEKTEDFGDRYVSTRSADYDCGVKLYITTCNEEVCKYTKINDKPYNGTVERMALKSSESLAKAECDNKIVYGNRYISSTGVNYTCGDKLFVTNCDEKVCEFSHVNGNAISGVVPRNDLKVSKVDVGQCKKTEDFGERYAIINGGNYSCGDALYITTCDDNNCNYSKVNGLVASGSIDRQSIETDKGVALNACNNTEHGDRYVTVNGDNFTCGDKLYVSSCSLDICNYTKVTDENGVTKSIEGTIDRDLLKADKALADAQCKETTVTDNQKNCNNVKKENMIGESSYTLCYPKASTEEARKDLLNKYYKCDETNGYKFDRTHAVSVGEESCNSKNAICSQTYNVSCTKGKSAKPIVSVSSGIVQGRLGSIKVSAKANEGYIVAYYVSENYKTPTEKSGWTKMQSDEFAIQGTPGIKYIWVKDNKGNVSEAVSGAILDSKTLNTTLKKIELVDNKGKIQTPNRVGYYDETIKPNKYALLSNDIAYDSKVLADGFNPFDMEYKLEVSSPTISVYATLTSTDSKYVSGYEPRTVNLDYGVNTILIKIENNEGKVRTYTILVTRNDDRTSDNTLRDITLSEGKINFNANVTDYKIEISGNTKSVDVNSIISSDKASYVSGYEPGKVMITGDTTVKLLKVQSETGSTRTYVLTFVRKGTDIITDESLMLSDLVVPGSRIAFEESISNYSLSVGYDTENIDIKPVLKNKDSNYIIRIKKKNDSNYVEISNNGLTLDVGENFIEIEVTNYKGEKSYYRLTIIRKEFGLEISNDTSLKDLKVLGYNIDFNPKTKDYVVRIKQEKSLVITAVPASNRAEVFIRGNEELTGFSTVRIKVVAENGDFETYSVDIKKDAFNKVIEIGAIVVGAIIIMGASVVVVLKKKNKANREYFEE